MVRAAGIEPASQAWEARILPMYYARIAKGTAGTLAARTAVDKCTVHFPGSGRENAILVFGVAAP